MTKTRHTKPIAHGASERVADAQEILGESLQEFRDRAVGRFYEFDVRAMEYAQQAIVGAWDFAGALAQAIGLAGLPGNRGDDLGTPSIRKGETTGIESTTFHRGNRAPGARRGDPIRFPRSQRT